MDTASLSTFVKFKGQLSLNDKFACNIRFRARILSSGELQIDLGKPRLTRDNRFVLKEWEAREFLDFTLVGKAEDGTEFATNKLYFSSIKIRSRKTKTTLSLVARCSTARFQRIAELPAERPVMRIWLKGFRNYPDLHALTELGPIVMQGERSEPVEDTISGSITLEASARLEDASLWREQAENLVNHVRRIMSFASASMLRAPVREYRIGRCIEVECLEQSRQTAANLRVFHYLNQQSVFDAAVQSFFTPRIPVKNLYFAIEWFAMEANYAEARLINGMTALENMVESYLDGGEALIQDDREFKKTRKALRGVIRTCLEKWQPDLAQEIGQELNEKLSDLNRRSLLRKLNTLAKQWKVPLDDIGESCIQDAKRARDHVVHRGKYGQREGDPDLWAHVCVVREVVTRFFLAAIGYKGRYFTYIGGCQDAVFPRPPEAMSS